MMGDCDMMVEDQSKNEMKQIKEFIIFSSQFSSHPPFHFIFIAMWDTVTAETDQGLALKELRRLGER